MDEGARTWREMIEEEMSRYGESFADAVGYVFGEVHRCDRGADYVEGVDEMFRVLRVGYGGDTGAPFTVWTRRRVYFPSVYDGFVGVASVSRDPDCVPTFHVGGG